MFFFVVLVTTVVVSTEVLGQTGNTAYVTTEEESNRTLSDGVHTIALTQDIALLAEVSTQYQDAELTAFVTSLTNSVISEAGAVTNIEKLRAIYDFIALQFNHTYPMRTSSIRAAIDGTRRPTPESVPLPDGISGFTMESLFAPEGPGMIFGRRSIPRDEDYRQSAWYMLSGIYAAPGNYASLYTYMAKAAGFEAMPFAGFFRDDTNFPHVWSAVRLDNNWYFFDVQQESFRNNTGQASHNFFMQPVADARIQERYNLCPDCLARLAAIAPIQGATIFSAGTATVTPVPQATANDIRVLLNGIALNFDVPPAIVNERTMIPLRAVSEALGAEVDWDGATRGIALRKEGISIRMAVDNRRVEVGEKPLYIDVAPMILDGRTLVPLRAISEMFGYEVSWDSATSTAIITT